MRLHALVKTTAGRASTAGAHNKRRNDCGDVNLCYAVLLAMTGGAGRVASTTVRDYQRLCLLGRNARAVTVHGPQQQYTGGMRVQHRRCGA